MSSHSLHLDDRRYGGVLDWVELAMARVRLGPHCWFVFHHLRRAPDPYGPGRTP